MRGVSVLEVDWSSEEDPDLPEQHPLNLVPYMYFRIFTSTSNTPLKKRGVRWGQPVLEMCVSSVIRLLCYVIYRSLVRDVSDYSS